jgi:RNA polymerase sigma-70 factor (ECF subfamily)
LSTVTGSSVAPLLLKNRLSCTSVPKSCSADHIGFEDIYRQYGRRVYWLCLRMVKNPADAEDLTQEVFMQVFLKMHQFQGRAAFFTWLHKVAVNVVLMRLRKRSQQMTSLEEILNPEKSDNRSLDCLTTIDTRLAGTIDRVLLARAIVCLPNHYRLAFALHDVAGYRHREIATRMRWSISNSKSNVQRARSRLRKLLKASARTPAPENSPYEN